MTSLNSVRHAHHQYFMDLEQRHSQQEITAAELTTLCLIPELVRLNKGFQRSPLLREICAVEVAPESELSALMKFVKNYSWKGHTDRIRRSLYQWHLGRYPLVLWNHIPTPFELLQIQANGKRIITVFNTPDKWEQIHFGKTAWEFIAHDLIHADHFFEKTEWQTGQIAFYQFIINNWDQDLICHTRTYCQEQFDYLISDMNSHPQHMYQTLNALCLMARKKMLDLNFKERLPEIEEKKFQEQMDYFLATRLLK